MKISVLTVKGFFAIKFAPDEKEGLRSEVYHRDCPMDADGSYIRGEDGFEVCVESLAIIDNADIARQLREIAGRLDEHAAK